VGKGGRYIRLKILPPLFADCVEIWETQTPGKLRACSMLIALHVLYMYIVNLQGTMLTVTVLVSLVRLCIRLPFFQQICLVTFL
jgi:hypothetical protein